MVPTPLYPTAPITPPSRPQATPAASFDRADTPPKTKQVDVAESDDKETQLAKDARQEIVPLTLDEAEWLNDVTQRLGYAGPSSIIGRLIEWANAETPAAKKQIFLVIRCRRCSAGAKGGVKADHEIELPSCQWQWLQNVQARCNHASLAKTIRIIIDFYMPLCKADEEFQQKVLPARGYAGKADRHKCAVKRVDPSRAPRGTHSTQSVVGPQESHGGA